jgi:hypothetical protein
VVESVADLLSYIRMTPKDPKEKEAEKVPNPQP